MKKYFIKILDKKDIGKKDWFKSLIEDFGFKFLERATDKFEAHFDSTPYTIGVGILVELDTSEAQIIKNLSWADLISKEDFIHPYNYDEFDGKYDVTVQEMDDSYMDEKLNIKICNYFGITYEDIDLSDYYSYPSCIWWK